MNKKFRKNFVNVLLTVSAILFSLVLAEAFIIFIEPRVCKGWFEYDPEVGFRVRPHTKMEGNPDTNEFGFNTLDFKHEKTPGTYRIVVVGDSYSWAGGFEKNYTAFLQREFNSRLGVGRVEVINTGYPCTNTAEQLPILRRYAMQYHPDLVLLGFFAGNDFLDADPNMKQIVVNDTFFRVPRNREFVLFGSPVILESQFFSLVNQRLKIAYEQRKAKQEFQVHNPIMLSSDTGLIPTFPRDTFLDIERFRLEFFNKKTLAGEQFKENIPYIFQSLLSMKNLVEGSGAKFVVTIFPDEFQTEDKLFKEIVARGHLQENNYDLQLAQNILKKYLGSLNVPVIDLLPHFREVLPSESLYILQDTHLNHRGNELTAKVLFSKLGQWFSPRARGVDDKILTHVEKPAFIRGILDKVDARSSLAYGWALDSRSDKKTVPIQFFMDDFTGSNQGAYVGSTLAQIARSDVNHVLGVTGRHGFVYAIPDKFFDGKPHRLYAFASQGGSRGEKVELIGSPMSFQELKPVDTKRIAKSSIR